MWEVEAETGMSDYNKQTEVEKDFFYWSLWNESWLDTVF